MRGGSCEERERWEKYVGRLVRTHFGLVVLLPRSGCRPEWEWALDWEGWGGGNTQVHIMRAGMAVCHRRCLSIQLAMPITLRMSRG